MTVDPYKDNTKKASKASDEFALDLAYVLETQDNSTHKVIIQPAIPDSSGEVSGGPEPARVATTQDGDIAIPSEGSLVVVGYARGRRPVVLARLYSQQDTVRSHGVKERHIGSSDNRGVYLHGGFAAAPQVSQDPTDPPNGAIWYRTDTDEYKGRRGGTTVKFAMKSDIP